MEQNYDVKVMLHEASEKLRRQSESIDSLKAHARRVFGASSVIISLIGALQVFSTVPANFKWLYVGIITAMLLLYIGLVTLCLIVLSPSRFHGPIQIELDTLKKAFIGKEEREVIKRQIVDYLNAIDLNQPGISTRQKMTTWASISFALIVICVIIAGILTRLDTIKVLLG